MLDEDNLVRYRVEKGQPANPYTLSPSLPSSTAFAAVSRPKSPHHVCANCKKEGHLADFCISPGGKMAGQTIEEAKAAYRASSP